MSDTNTVITSKVEDNLIIDLRPFKCDKCKKDYSRKQDLTTHLKKVHKVVNKQTSKIDNIENVVVSDEKLNNILEVNNVNLNDTLKYSEDYLNTKNKLKKVLENVEDKLRNDGIVGEKASNTIIKLLILRLLEPRFDHDIDIFDITKNIYGPRITEENKLNCKITHLVKSNINALKGNFKTVWDCMLSVHPITKIIFNRELFIDIETDRILFDVLDTFAKFDFSTIVSDVLSDVYQEFMHSHFKGQKGSRLGQHFTPKVIIDLIIKLAENEFDGQNKTYCDPFCGTGGFLYQIYDKINKNKKPEEQIDLSKNIFGSEIDKEVHKYALANMLIKSGKIYDKIERESAFTYHKDKKYDVVLSNPPFGLEGMVGKDKSYDWFSKFKTNNGNLLSLQLLMEILKPGGYCAFVFPNGSQLKSEGKTEINIRKKLVEEYDLQKIIIMEKGIFEYTSIKTLIIIFKKPNDLVNKTKIVEFSNLDLLTMNIDIIKNISYDEIKKQNYILNIDEYKEKIKLEVNNKFEIKKLKELCNIIPSGKRTVNDALPDGIYNFYSSSIEKIMKINIADHIENTIIMNKVNGSGKCQIFIDDKFSNTSGALLIRSNEKCDIKYIYCYMRYIKPQIEDICYSGELQKTLHKDKLFELEIPYLSIEEQKIITEYFIEYEKQRNSVNKNIEDFEKNKNNLLSYKYNNYPQNVEIKKLKELCNIIPSGKRTVNDALPDGIYNFYSSSIEKIMKINIADHIENTIIMNKVNGSGKCQIFIDDKFSNTSGALLIRSNEKCDIKYIYCYMRYIKPQIEDICYSGELQKTLHKDKLFELEIPYLSIEEQKKYIEWYEMIQKLIKDIDIDIENCKKQIININSMIKYLFI